MCFLMQQVYEEGIVVEIEQHLHRLICEVYSPWLDLLANLTTLVLTSALPAAPTINPVAGASTSAKLESDLFLPMREHLLSQFQAPISPSNSLLGCSVSFSSSLVSLLRLFRCVCAHTPSLLYRLPPSICLGTIQLSILCLSFSSAEFTIAQLAVSTLSQVVLRCFQHNSNLFASLFAHTPTCYYIHT